MPRAHDACCFELTFLCPAGLDDTLLQTHGRGEWTIQPCAAFASSCASTWLVPSANLARCGWDRNGALRSRTRPARLLMAVDRASPPSTQYYDEHRFASEEEGVGEAGAEDWLDVDFMKCLGRGGYGDVYEARITAGPLAGLRAVAKRALPRREGKIKWRARSWDSVSVSSSKSLPDLSWTTYYRLKTGSPSAAEPTSFMHSYASMTSSEEETADKGESRTERGLREAVEYLNVEDYVNRLIAAKCPDIAAPYVGDYQASDGTRWLVWLWEQGSVTLADLITQAHKEGSMGALAAGLNVPDFRDDDARSTQRLVSTLAEQLLAICQALAQQGICHRDIKPGNLLICPSTHRVKVIDFGAAAAVGTAEQVGFTAERGPCDEKYHAPEQLIDEEHWHVYDVYSVGLTLVRVLFRPLWDGEHFSAFLEEFRSDKCKSNLDILCTTMLLRQVPALTPAQVRQALSQAARAHVPLFTGAARTPRGLEYLQLSQRAEPVQPHVDSPPLSPAAAATAGVGATHSPEAQEVAHSKAPGGGLVEKPAKRRWRRVDKLNDLLTVRGEVEVYTAKLTSTQPPSPDWWNARIDKILICAPVVDGGDEEEARVYVSYEQSFGVYAKYPEDETVLRVFKIQGKWQAEGGRMRAQQDVKVTLDVLDFRLGLRALETPLREGEGGVTWNLMRKMLEKKPDARVSAREALALLGRTQDKAVAEVEYERMEGAGDHMSSVKQEIEIVKSAHAQLNDQSDALRAAVGVSDAIVHTQMQELKKKKLLLKDRLARLQSVLDAGGG